MTNEKLLEKHADIIEHQGMIACPSACLDMMDEAFTEMKRADPNVKIAQVKTKFGQMRVYVSGNKEAQDLASKAEDLGSRILEGS